jgi:hypothetical protein
MNGVGFYIFDNIYYNLCLAVVVFNITEISIIIILIILKNGPHKPGQFRVACRMQGMLQIIGKTNELLYL